MPTSAASIGGRQRRGWALAAWAVVAALILLPFLAMLLIPVAVDEANLMLAANEATSEAVSQ